MLMDQPPLRVLQKQAQLWVMYAEKNGQKYLVN